MTSVPPGAYVHPGPPPERPERPLGAPPSRTPSAELIGSPRWRPWTGWAALASGFGATIFAGLLAAIVVSAAGGSVDDTPPGVNIGLTFFQDLALIAAALGFARLADTPLPYRFGLVRPPQMGRAIGLLVLVWIGFYGFTLAWVSALGLHQKDELPDDLGVNGSTAALISVLVLVTVVAPVAEELVFRGYFFAAASNGRARLGGMRLGGVSFAAVVTGLVFGGVHLGSAPVGFVVPLAFFGFALCLLYRYTGSLMPGITLHALNNAIAFSVSQDWDWQIPLVMVGGVCGALTLAVCLARGLDARFARSAL